MENLPLLNEIKIKWFFTKKRVFLINKMKPLIEKPCIIIWQFHQYSQSGAIRK